MTIHTIRHLILLNMLLLTSAVHAETTNCTAITTLPYTITTQGVYCLTGNLATSMTSGNAIDIQTNNVTIDLNGFKLGGLAAGTGTTTYGINANQRKNITIRNGSIRGFFYGIFLNDNYPYTASQGNLIEYIRAEQNTYIGIYARGRGNIVRHNQVVDTGGRTPANNAYGIAIYGPGARTLDNDISATAATGANSGYALYLFQADSAVVERNRIDDVSSGTAPTSGVYILSSLNVLVIGNRITSAQNGVLFDASTGKYMSNLTSNVTTPFAGGTAVGIND